MCRPNAFTFPVRSDAHTPMPDERFCEKNSQFLSIGPARFWVHGTMRYIGSECSKPLTSRQATRGVFIIQKAKPPQAKPTLLGAANGRIACFPESGIHSASCLKRALFYFQEIRKLISDFVRYLKFFILHLSFFFVVVYSPVHREWMGFIDADSDFDPLMIIGG